MKLFLGALILLFVLISLLLGVVALLDYKSKQRELELTFIGRVVAVDRSDQLNQIMVEDSVGPIILSRVRNELYEFVEIGDTLIKKEGDPNCMVKNRTLHKNHVFEIYAH